MGTRTRVRVRFGDVDAAGIVFYPRYFEMLNAAVEDWFASMGHDFRTLHLSARIGVPTVRIECEFTAPSQLGEELEIEVVPVRLGRSSCEVRYLVTGGGQPRMKASSVLVCMNLETRKAASWPVELAERIRAGLETSPPGAE